MTRLTHLFHHTNARTSPDINVCALACTSHLTQWKGRPLAAMRPCAVRCTSLIRKKKKKEEGQNLAWCTQKLLEFKKPAAPKRWYKQTNKLHTQLSHNPRKMQHTTCQHLTQSSSLQGNSTPIRNFKKSQTMQWYTKTSSKITFESN